ncbi:InlB B-repeat-containing protein [Ohtaekwangia koreensis]|uniref:Listeria/Bacterioides repeat-containing protein/gliding motility-associated C-terminal domain-containing protein n=1 Tax=Ohtaekwangia koreensis TaxID=688867 RepID=A0A1T5IPJ8_9BACT|nr:InlB B-repeat-containing protein [Ohtaekwangia koreensis]SKC41012.1 Listeria/Bacterioides repeat-containing protein/gliding motility-associated C-terminal domain-containing protein [Ohtaekwangia koreensis]
MQRLEKKGTIMPLPFCCLKFIQTYLFIGLMLTSLAVHAQSTCYETVTLPSDGKFGGGDVPGSKLIGTTYGAGEGPGIYIVADGGYRLYLNGELLTYDNAAGRVRFIPMTFLPGKNAISIVGVNGHGAPGVLMHLDELEKPYVTGAGWKALNNPPDDSWKKESYNDSAWPAATIAANGTLTSLPSGGSLSSPTFPSNSLAKWIWSGSKSDKNVVLRYTFNIKAVGFGALTTGGKRSNIVIVKDETDLLNLLSDTTSRIILIPEGVFDFRNYRIEPNSKVCETPCQKFGTACGTTPATPGLTYKRNITPTTSCEGKYITIKSWDRLIGVTRNKSIIGMGRGASLRGASFYSNQNGNVKNIIFRNLKVWDVNPHIIEAGGGIELINVEKLWVDHCSFKWISDGNDVNQAKEVTFSWDHWDGYNEFQCNGRDFYAALVQDSDVTYDHMYWDGGSGRNPKAYKNTRVHVLNNYHKDNIYAAVSSFNGTAEVRVEGNYFEKVCFVTYKTEETSRIYCNKNKYVNTAGFLLHQTAVKTEPTDVVFTPPYKYTIDLADSIPTLVMARAGAGGPWGTMPRYTDTAGRYNTAPDVTISAPSLTEVVVTATDGNGIGKVELYSGITKIGEVQNAPYKLNVGADTCTRSIVAKVYDTKGLATMSLPVTLCRSLIIHKYKVNKGPWVTGASATVHEGDTIKFSPRPSTVLSAWSWKGPGNYSASTREIQLAKVSSAQAGVYTVTLSDGAGCSSSENFTLTVTSPVKYTLATTATPSAGGTVSGAGSYNSGDVVTVKATPTAGYTFTGWSGDATGTSSSISVTMNGNKTVTANFQLIKYTLTATATPSAGGTVSGAGSYNSGDIVTVKATAAPGYSFIGWSGDATGTSSSITITIDGNKTVTANFQLIKYTLTVTATPSAGGTVSGAGSYNSGDIVTVKATPAAGYTFTGWSGDATGTSSSITITIDGNKTVTANFQLIKYTLTTTATPSAGGTVIGAGSYNSGDVVTVKATPAAGYIFTGWSGDAAGSSPSVVITMNGNKSIVANFQVKAPDKYTLTTIGSPAAGGTLSGGGSYNSGDVVTVTATPATGYTFTGWSGDATGTSSTVAITMSSNKTVTANFQLIKYTLTTTATPSAAGTVIGAGSYNSGDVVTVKATPAAGYIFTGWSGDAAGSSPSVAITMNGNKSIVANFQVKAPDKYTLTTTTTPSAGGTVIGAGSYNSGDVVTIKATPAAGYTFTGWSGDATGTSPSVAITMNGNKSVVANFQVKAPDKYTLTTIGSPAAGGTLSGGGSYNSGDVVTVKATPAAGYTFTGWSGDATGTSSSITITMNGNKTVTANFQLKSPDRYTLTITASPAAGGAVSGSGSYNAGDVVTVKAIPEAGYTFTGWSGDASGISPSITITMDGNKIITANFQLRAPDKYTLTTTAFPIEGGAVSGAGSYYNAGDVVTVKAIPEAGYTFTGWSGDASGISPSITITMDGNKIITANFQLKAPDKYTLTTTAFPIEGGSVSGAGSYDAGTVVTLMVTPTTGYIFTGWSGDVVDTSPAVTITMNSDKSVTANFEEQSKESVTVKPPKLFSPDNRGDASTETWQIENAYLLDGAEIVVYNRQGQKVYSSIGYSSPWDGTSAGNPLPDGAYFYIIVYSDHKKQTGSVTIARLN